MPKKFAVFDIDGTLIRWQLYHAIAGELGRRGLLQAGGEERIKQARMTWKKRSSSESFREYEHELVVVYYEALKTIKVTDYLAAIDAVFEAYKDQVYTYTRDLIRTLKAEDYLLFAISGSQQEIVEKLANYYGFDDCVGTAFVRKDGYFTGEEASVINRKAELLQQMIEKHGATTEGSVAIGDSEGDIPLLEAVERPIAFNPSAKLFEAAKGRGWEVVLERKNMVYSMKELDGSYILA